jgi:glycosyltransferase involved in cell wall biosynthesis
MCAKKDRQLLLVNPKTKNSIKEKGGLIVPPNNLMNVSLIIPTFRRPLLLARTLTAFASQLCCHDEIIIIIHANDPFRGNYDKLIKEIQVSARVQIIINPSNNLSHSYNLGLKGATKDVLLFSDDDCIPDEHLVESHLGVYECFGERIIGVTGRITSAILSQNKITPIINKPILHVHRPWKMPMNGMESWFFFITQGGRLFMRSNQEYLMAQGAKLIPSLPIGGGNMSFRRHYLKNIFVDETQKRAFRFEQQLLLSIWKSISQKRKMSEYRYVLNLSANTFHIENVERTTSRPRDIKSSIDLAVESVKSRFRFKIILPENILVRAIFRDLFVEMIKLLYFSAKGNSKKGESDWQTSSRYLGEFIGSLIGFFAGIAYYATWCFSDGFLFSPPNTGVSIKREEAQIILSSNNLN